MANFSVHRVALSIGGAILLLVASVGISAAQSTPTPSSTSKSRAVIDDAAAKLGLTGDQLAQALKQARHDLGVGSATRFSRPAAMAAAAKALGLPDVKTLRQQVAGTTLTSLAQKRGVDPTSVANAIKSSLDAQVDAQVSAGKLNANRATTVKQRLAAKVDAFMTRQFKPAKEAQT